MTSVPQNTEGVAPPGKICTSCHQWKPLGDFYPHKSGVLGAVSHCKPCFLARQKERRANRTPERLETQREWRRTWEGTEEHKEWHRQDRKRRPEVYAARAKRKRLRSPEYYRELGREHGAAQQKARRDRMRENGGLFSAEEWQAMLKQYGHRCLCCGATEDLMADHVVPLCKGGTSNAENRQPLCRACNSKKFNKAIDYRPKG